MVNQLCFDTQVNPGILTTSDAHNKAYVYYLIGYKYNMYVGSCEPQINVCMLLIHPPTRYPENNLISK